MSDEQPALWEKMHALAEQTPEHAAELREKADAFEKASRGFYADPQTATVQQFCGSWARARKLYSQLTGEPLI